MNDALSVVMLGASGATGGQALATLLRTPQVRRITLLGRRPVPGLEGNALVKQVTIDIHDPNAYGELLAGHKAAICTLGVSQPSQMSKQQFLRIDSEAPLAFARACKQAGVGHFELLGAVGAHASSASFYLGSKGKLRDAIVALGFPRASIFQPSMILTPTNRFGLSQAIVLKVWPKLDSLLPGPLRKYRGVRVETLGAAMARNIARPGAGVEIVQWDGFLPLAGERA